METLLRTGAKATLLFFLAGLTQAATQATIPERLRDAIARIAPQLRPELRKDGIEVHSGPKGTGTVSPDNVEKACAQEPDHCDEAIQRFATSIVASLTETENIVPTESNVFPVVRSIGMMHRYPECDALCIR